MMRSVLALVNSRDMTTPADVSQLLGIDIDAAGKYVRRLAGYGLIPKTARGRYSPNTLSGCPFPESVQVKE
jgi:predicted transcriptional regulator